MKFEQITDDNYQKYTPDEIMNNYDSYDSKIMLEKYYGKLNELIVNRVARKCIEENRGKSIEMLDMIIEESLLLSTSQIFFPNDYIHFYKNITEIKANKHYTCALSNAPIYPGSEYCRYQPLLDNLTTKKTYVLSKPIIVETGYSYYLPATIHDFENFHEYLSNTRLINNNYPFDFEDASVNIGEGFCLRKIGKKNN